MSKFKSTNRYLESTNFFYNRTKGYCLIVCQTGVLFLGHPVHCHLLDASILLDWESSKLLPNINP